MHLPHHPIPPSAPHQNPPNHISTDHRPSTIIFSHSPSINGPKSRNETSRRTGLYLTRKFHEDVYPPRTQKNLRNRNLVGGLFVVFSKSAPHTVCSLPTEIRTKPALLQAYNHIITNTFKNLPATIHIKYLNNHRINIRVDEMCRSTDYHGFQPRKDRLKIRAFFLRFSGLTTQYPLPESLTLSYLPRINENELEIDGSKIRPDSPAFVTLYRVVNAKVREGNVIFGSRDRVRAGDGIRFEVYLREEKVLKGVFRKDEGQEWKLECKCVLENESVAAGITEAEVCVEVEGHVAMSERVKVVVKRTKKHRNCGFKRLEEIPEEGEVDDDEWDESDVCCCNCGSDDGESEMASNVDGEDEVLDMDMGGVRWAVDVGLWVMCLGFGYLVSKASAKTLRRRRLI